MPGSKVLLQSICWQAKSQAESLLLSSSSILSAINWEWISIPHLDAKILGNITICSLETKLEYWMVIPLISYIFHFLLKSWAFSIIVLPLSMFLLLLIGRIEPHFCDVPLPFPPHFVLYLIMFLQILHCRLSGWAVIFFSIRDCSSCFSMIGIWGDSWYCPCTLISCTDLCFCVEAHRSIPQVAVWFLPLVDTLFGFCLLQPTHLFKDQQPHCLASSWGISSLIVQFPCSPSCPLYQIYHSNLLQVTHPLLTLLHLHIYTSYHLKSFCSTLPVPF